uniref:Uncharacterized protein n=1 Tax=Arundo donax TaxID=35708 RepID=A0A0A9CLT4_ARUDO
MVVYMHSGQSRFVCDQCLYRRHEMIHSSVVPLVAVQHKEHIFSLHLLSPLLITMVSLIL